MPIYYPSDIFPIKSHSTIACRNIVSANYTGSIDLFTQEKMNIIREGKKGSRHVGQRMNFRGKSTDIYESNRTAVLFRTYQKLAIVGARNRHFASRNSPLFSLSIPLVRTTKGPTSRVISHRTFRLRTMWNDRRWISFFVLENLSMKIKFGKSGEHETRKYLSTLTIDSN